MTKRSQHTVCDILHTTRKGFTLLELLIVMTVIGGLAAIVLVGYPGVRKRARDTQRKSDLKQYQTAFELYNNREGKYPIMSSNLATSTNCTTLGVSGCPDDPDTSKHYRVTSATIRYILFVELELPKQSGSDKNYFVLCWNGVAKETVKSTEPSFMTDCN